MGAEDTAAVEFRRQLAAEGSRLLLPSGVVVPGLVKRDLVSNVRRAGLPDFTTKASVSIEIATPDTMPKNGDYISPTTNPSVRYRVAEVLVETAYSVRLNCQPFNPQALT